MLASCCRALQWGLGGALAVAPGVPSSGQAAQRVEAREQPSCGDESIPRGLAWYGLWNNESIGASFMLRTVIL